MSTSFYTQNGFVYTSIAPVLNAKVQIIKDNHIDTYWLLPNKDQNVFPLQYGDGTYTIKVYQSNEAGTYALTHNERVFAQNTSNCYLGPCQYIWYGPEVEALSNKLNALNPKNKISAYYNYCYQQIFYDHMFVLTNDDEHYVPDLKKVIAQHRGICFDKASLLCALCRLNGIEARLVIGIVGGMNHAWCQVKVNGRWRTMDPTAGKKYKAKDYKTQRMC